ncbi:esterase/lipase family protein [Streptomyces sp. NPDC003006]
MALSLAAVLTGASGVAADPGPTPPPRTNSTNEPLYMVKGFDPPEINDDGPGVSCTSRWNTAERAMKRWGWRGKFVQVGFYNGDTHCNLTLARNGDGTRDLPLVELGRRLAWKIYNRDSRYGRSVDLVGHSMGGLIIRAALTGTERHMRGWPPYIYVEDAVTLGTPHYGAWISDLICSAVPINRQCEDMRSESVFMRWLHSTNVPKSEQGTDWTLIGSEADTDVAVGSATPVVDEAQHLVRYTSSSNIGHSQLRTIAYGWWPLRHSHDSGENWTDTRNGAAPLRATFNSLYWESRW